MHIECRGDINRAIRLLKRRVDADGIFREIRLREQSPNRTDRRKAKDRAALKRRLSKERSHRQAKT